MGVIYSRGLWGYIGVLGFRVWGLGFRAQVSPVPDAGIWSENGQGIGSCECNNWQGIRHSPKGPST